MSYRFANDGRWHCRGIVLTTMVASVCQGFASMLSGCQMMSIRDLQYCFENDGRQRFPMVGHAGVTQQHLNILSVLNMHNILKLGY